MLRTNIVVKVMYPGGDMHDLRHLLVV